MQSFFKTLKALEKVEFSIVSFQYPFKNEMYNWNGINVYACGGANGKINRLGTWRKAWSYINKIRREHQVVRLHSFWFTECALVGNMYSLLHNNKGLAHSTTLMGQDVKSENRYLNFLNIYKNNKIISLSNDMSILFEKNTGKEITTIIPWGISRQDILKNPKNNIRDIDVLGVGSLSKLKNYQYFIEIIAHLQLEKPNIRAIIIGDGPEYHHLQKQIDDLKLHQNITLKGKIPHDEVLQYMARSRVFLHTSIYEGYGYVLYEAMSQGAKIVNNDTDMIKKIKTILDNEQDFEPDVPYTMEETARLYLEFLECI